MTAVWKTAKGELIKVSEMTTSHLLNTIRFLRRKGEIGRYQEINAAWSCYSMLQGEIATYYAERDIQALEDEDVDDWLMRNEPSFEAMLEEAGNRKVSV